MNRWNMLAVFLLSGLVWGLGGCGRNGDPATSAPVTPLPDGHGELEGFAYYYIEHTDHKDPGKQVVMSLTDTNGVSTILTTDAAGRFSVLLPAGVYSATHSVPWNESTLSLGKVEVTARVTTEAQFEIDRMEFFDQQ